MQAVQSALKLTGPLVIDELKKEGTPAAINLAEYLRHVSNLFHAMDVKRTSNLQLNPKNKPVLTFEQRQTMLNEAATYFNKVA